MSSSDDDNKMNRVSDQVNALGGVDGFPEEFGNFSEMEGKQTQERSTTPTLLDDLSLGNEKPKSWRRPARPASFSHSTNNPFQKPTITKPIRKPPSKVKRQSSDGTDGQDIQNSSHRRNRPPRRSSLGHKTKTISATEHSGATSEGRSGRMPRRSSFGNGVTVVNNRKIPQKKTSEPISESWHGFTVPAFEDQGAAVDDDSAWNAFETPDFGFATAQGKEDDAVATFTLKESSRDVRKHSHKDDGGKSPRRRNSAKASDTESRGDEKSASSDKKSRHSSHEHGRRVGRRHHSSTGDSVSSREKLQPPSIDNHLEVKSPRQGGRRRRPSGDGSDAKDEGKSGVGNPSSALARRREFRKEQSKQSLTSEASTAASTASGENSKDRERRGSRRHQSRKHADDGKSNSGDSESSLKDTVRRGARRTHSGDSSSGGRSLDRSNPDISPKGSTRRGNRRHYNSHHHHSGMTDATGSSGSQDGDLDLDRYHKTAEKVRSPTFHASRKKDKDDSKGDERSESHRRRHRKKEEKETKEGGIDGLLGKLADTEGNEKDKGKKAETMDAFQMSTMSFDNAWDVTQNAMEPTLDTTKAQGLAGSDGGKTRRRRLKEQPRKA